MQSSPLGMKPVETAADPAADPVASDIVFSANTSAPVMEAIAIPTAPAAAPFRKLRLEISFAIFSLLTFVYFSF